MGDETENEELPDIEEAVGDGDEKSLEPSEDTGESDPSLEAEEADARDLGLIMEVPLRLSVELGSASLPVRDVLELRSGSVVELDRMHGEPADVYANDRLIARGELEVQDDRVAVRITELLSANVRSDPR